jgi:hypothetical protein
MKSTPVSSLVNHIAPGSSNVGITANSSYVPVGPYGRFGVDMEICLPIRGMRTVEIVFTAYPVKQSTEDGDTSIKEITKELRTRFGIEHITVVQLR